jgi:hypothetical protein
MRPRAELAIAIVLLVALGVVSAALGSRRAGTSDEDPRRSTYLAGPSGAQGFAEALTRLGVRVERYRHPTESMNALARRRRRTLVALLGPSLPLGPVEARFLAGAPFDVLLAGAGTQRALRCLGYAALGRRGRGATAAAPGGAGSVMVRAELVHHLAQSVVDSSELADGQIVTCVIPPVSRVDTLLRTASGHPVAVRLWLANDRTATLVADDRLFTNRALRETDAGPLALSWVVPRYTHVVIDEYHHGYEASGSLVGATLGWSLHSPWGWMAWQLALIGLIALLTAGVRFGPIRSAVERRRRSPLEHVRALATALAAARGHDVAVGLMVQGLRRRLTGPGKPIRSDLGTWLENLSPTLRTSRGREALTTLTALSRSQPDSEGVLQAADAVETLWEELKPS